MIFAQRKLRLTMQHVYGHSGNLGNECADHCRCTRDFRLYLKPQRYHSLDSPNFDATACFDGCHSITEILERSQRIRTDAVSLSQKKELALCSPSGSLCLLCISRALWSFVFLALSLFPFWFLFPQTSDGQTFFIRVCRTESRRLLRAQHVESSVGLAFSSGRSMVFSPLFSWKSTWPRSHCLVTLLLMYSVTRKACTILHDASWGTIVHGVFLILWHH